MALLQTCRTGLVFILLQSLTPGAQAEPQTEIIGGDYYRSGSESGEVLSALRDVFVTGASVTVRGRAVGDVHFTGFDIDVEPDADNAYAAGGAVSIRSNIASDLTAVGGSVKTAASSRTGGSARLLGGTVTINGAVDGSLMAMSGEVFIDAPIAGDVRVTGGSIVFGDDAQIGGTLTYSAPDEVSIPEAVIPADRIAYNALAVEDIFAGHEDWEMREFPLIPAFVSVLAGFIITLAFTVLVAALYFYPLRPKWSRRGAWLQCPGRG